MAADSRLAENDAGDPGSEATDVAVDPSRCASYKVGHHAHVIQAKLAWKTPGRPGKAMALGDGWAAIALDDGEELRRWSHDDDRIRELLTSAGGRVELRDYDVLAGPGGSILSVAAQPSACSVPEDGHTVSAVGAVRLHREDG